MYLLSSNTSSIGDNIDSPSSIILKVVGRVSLRMNTQRVKQITMNDLIGLKVLMILLATKRKKYIRQALTNLVTIIVAPAERCYSPTRYQEARRNYIYQEDCLLVSRFYTTAVFDSI